MLKKIAKAAATALAVTGLASAAQAADSGTGGPSWAGVYVGGHAGGAWGDADYTLPYFAGSKATFEDSFDLEGWLAGVHVGANVQHGAFVLGGELSLSGAGIEGSDCVAQQVEGDLKLSFPCKKEDEWLLLGLTRFGYAPGNWMGYLTLGVAVAGAQTSTDVVETGGGASLGLLPLSRASGTDVGFAVGGGAEVQLGRGLIAGVEYVHADFDGMQDGLLLVSNYSQTIDIARARLSMMFGDCCEETAALSKTGFASVLSSAGDPWSGVYFGGHAGYGLGETNATISNANTGTETYKDSFDLDGWLAGIHFGANVQRGNFVLGTELSLSGAGISGSKGVNCTTMTSTVDTEAESIGCRKDVDWLLLAMSRYGYAPRTSNWMAYLTAGAAIAGTHTDITFNNKRKRISGAALASGDNTEVGIAVGAGTEFKLGSNMVVGLDYVHAEFDSDTRHGTFVVTEWDQDIDLLRARFSMLLNACCEAESVASGTGFASAAVPTGWSGFYFGSNAAYGRANADLTATLVEDESLASFTDSIDDMSGYLLGAHMGGNMQLGRLVLGGELSISAGSIDGSNGPNCLELSDASGMVSADCKKEDKWLALALGRLGYAPGRFMGYVTAGAAMVGMQTDLLVDGLPATSASDTDLGYAVGGGAEFQIRKGLIAGVEYIHAQFNGAENGASFVTSSPTQGWEQEIDMVRGRLSYRFAGFCPYVCASSE